MKKSEEFVRESMSDDEEEVLGFLDQNWATTEKIAKRSNIEIKKLYPTLVSLYKKRYIEACVIPQKDGSITKYWRIHPNNIQSIRDRGISMAIPA